MVENRQQQLEDLLKKLNNQMSSVENTISLKQESIESEANTIKDLNRYHATTKYYYDMYSQSPLSEIDKMTTHEYSTYIEPLQYLVTSGSTVNVLYGETKAATAVARSHQDVSASLIAFSGANSTALPNLASYNSAWFPNASNITKRYNLEDTLYASMEYVHTYLTKGFPDVADDYDRFISTYHAFKADPTKYQDLIASRSLFFFKLIFDFVEKTFGVMKPKNRKRDIELFVYGKSTPIAIRLLFKAQASRSDLPKAGIRWLSS